MIELIEKLNFWNGKLPEIGFLRQSYIDKLLGCLDNSLVKVLTGQRRSGKSYLLRMLIRYLIKEKKLNPYNILYLNMEMHEFLSINSTEKFMQLISEYHDKFKPNGKVYLFLDEIQELQGWEKVVNSLSQNYAVQYEIFLTGSNAHLLSIELATYLTGRYIPIEVFPFSFGEYCEFAKLERNAESFGQYLHRGGMPEIFNLKTDENIRNYLDTLQDSILLNDIVQRYKVRDVALLQRLCTFLSDSVGSFFSANSVVRYLNGSGYKTNIETVSNHLKFLTDSYLFHEVDRFDIQGKKILTGERKYYLNDTAFKSFLSSSFDPGIGKYLENALYLHLLRHGYKVYVGRSLSGEVDFVAEKSNARIYCQAVYLLADENIIKREFRSLSDINDNFPKYVVSMDLVQMGNKNGIKHVQAWDFIK
jgi:uncharacterized protein